MTEQIEKILKVIVKTPERILFDGEAEAITTSNKKGPLDVLPFHENFISRIQEKLIIHEKGSQTKEFSLQSGILKVSSNTVQIFLGLESII